MTYKSIIDAYCETNEVYECPVLDNILEEVKSTDMINSFSRIPKRFIDQTYSFNRHAVSGYNAKEHWK